MRKTLIILILLLAFTECYALELVREKNAATVIVFPLADSSDTTALKSSASGLDSEIDQWSDSADNPDGFADCSNEAIEIGSTGQYYIVLTQGEMNEDYIIVQIKSTNAMTQTILIRTTIGDPSLAATTDDGGTINVTGGAVDTVTTLTGHTVQSGDSYAIVNSGTYGLSALYDILTNGTYGLSELADLITVVAGGDGSVVVDHDYGGADALAYQTAGGVGIDNAVIRAYLKTDYDAGNTGVAYIKASITTDVNGQWSSEMNLDPETYTLYYFKQGAYGPDTQEVTVE